jgi:hypothetical protein
MQGIQFIGTQRSGSNLLRLMLNQLSTISAPHPPHLLRTFAPHLEQYGDLKSEESFGLLASDIHEWIKANPVEWTNWNVSIQDLISESQQNSLVSLFETVYRLKARNDRANIWCCKSLANVHFVDQLESNGIHPFYLHLVRDGRDVACSFQKAIVGAKHIYHLAEKWSSEQILAHEVSIKYPERYVLVKYEDLIENPSEQVELICKAVGVAYDEQTMEYYRSEESEHTASSGEMWKNVVSPIISNNRYKYLEKLSREEIGLFNQIAEKQLKQYGYQVDTSKGDIEIDDTLVQRYNEENRLLIQEAQKSASPLDKALRRPQADLLEKIKNVTSSHNL